MVEKHPDNIDAQNNLGLALADSGKTAEAIAHYREVLRLKPDHARAHNNLANALAGLGQTSEAIEHYREALRLKPDYAEAHNNLGVALTAPGQDQRGHRTLPTSRCNCNPIMLEAHANLGNCPGRLGQDPRSDRALPARPCELTPMTPWSTTIWASLWPARATRRAIEHYREALRLKPGVRRRPTTTWPSLWSRAGKSRRGHRALPAGLAAETRLCPRPDTIWAICWPGWKNQEAIEQYRRLLQAGAPDCVEAQNNLAWLLATCEPDDGGDAARAVQLAERARQQGGRDDPQRLDTLAAAYAAAGRFPEAVTTAEKAIQLAQSAGQTALAKEIQSRCELYRAGRPYRRLLPSTRRRPAQAGSLPDLAGISRYTAAGRTWSSPSPAQKNDERNSGTRVSSQKRGDQGQRP